MDRDQFIARKHEELKSALVGERDRLRAGGQPSGQTSREELLKAHERVLGQLSPEHYARDGDEAINEAVRNGDIPCQQVEERPLAATTTLAGSVWQFSVHTRPDGFRPCQRRLEDPPLPWNDFGETASHDDALRQIGHLDLGPDAVYHHPLLREQVHAKGQAHGNSQKG